MDDETRLSATSLNEMVLESLTFVSTVAAVETFDARVEQWRARAELLPVVAAACSFAIDARPIDAARILVDSAEFFFTHDQRPTYTALVDSVASAELPDDVRAPLDHRRAELLGMRGEYIAAVEPAARCLPGVARHRPAMLGEGLAMFIRHRATLLDASVLESLPGAAELARGLPPSQAAPLNAACATVAAMWGDAVTAATLISRNLALPEGGGARARRRTLRARVYAAAARGDFADADSALAGAQPADAAPVGDFEPPDQAVAVTATLLLARDLNDQLVHLVRDSADPAVCVLLAEALRRLGALDEASGRLRAALGGLLVAEENAGRLTGVLVASLVGRDRGLSCASALFDGWSVIRATRRLPVPAGLAPVVHHDVVAGGSRSVASGALDDLIRLALRDL